MISPVRSFCWRGAVSVGLVVGTICLLATVAPGTAVARQSGSRHGSHRRSPKIKLPRAAPIPHGSSVVAAQVLATKVLAGGNSGAGALRTALKLSGIGIVRPHGISVQKPRAPRAGISIEANELLPAAALVAIPQTIPLDTLTTLVATASRIRHPNLLAGNRAVLKDLRTAAKSKSHTVRFFANFINDLRPSAGLLANTSGSGVELSRLQSYLLQYLWIGGLQQYYRKHRSRRHGRRSKRHRTTRSTSAHGARAQAAASHLQCEYDESASVITSIAGTAFSAATAQFTEWATKNSTTWGQKLENATASVNALLALARMMDESHSLKFSIKLVGGDPLVRTKEHTTSSYGANEKLKVSVNLELGKFQSTANCAKLAAAILGVDIGTNNNGPVADAQINWFIEDGVGGVLDNPVGLYALRGATGGGAFTTTNAAGESETGIQGLPQRTALPPDPAPYVRTTTVGVNLKLHKNDLKNDLPGMIGAAASGSALSAILGVLDHTPLFSATAPIKVQDWSRYYRAKFDSTINMSNPDATGSWTVNYVANPLLGPPPVPATGPATGSTIGTYVRADGTISQDGGSSTLTAGAGDLFDASFDLGGPFSSPTLAIDPHSPTESDHTCGDFGCIDESDDTVWVTAFANALHPERDQNGAIPLQLQRAPENNGSRLAAHGEWNQTLGAGEVIESTTVDVYSVPPPGS